MKQKVVIIGAGLGGLFTGAFLSKEGLDVTVIEKNATIGGGLQSFKRFGEIFDTGMHVIGGMREGGNIRRICEYLGIMDKVHLDHIGPNTIDTLYFAEDKVTYNIAMGKESFVNALCEKFPDQRTNLVTYVEALFNIVNELDMYFLRPESDTITWHSEDFLISANELISKYISNEKLQSVLAYMNPLYSGKKNATPSFIHALISVLYISGPSRFVGGSLLFAEALKECIENHGGKVIAGDGAKTIHSENKLITGITTNKGYYYSADYYISAIHPCSLIKLLEDPTIFPKSYRNRLEEILNSYSAFTLNIKLRPRTFKYIKHTGYYMSRYDKIWEFDNPEEEWPLGFLYMTPPEHEQGEYSNKMIITAPMTWELVQKWENTTSGNRTQEYKDWKDECAEKLIKMMEEIFPDFRSCIENVNTASPLTIRDFYAVKNGAMCGYSKDCTNMVLSQVPVVTKVKNLLLTGQNCNVHGFCGVPLVAITTSEAILGRNYILNKLNN